MTAGHAVLNLQVNSAVFVRHHIQWTVTVNTEKYTVSSIVVPHVHGENKVRQSVRTFRKK